MVTTQRWTIADLERIPQPMDDTRHELIDGELYVSTQPNWRHQFVGMRIAVVLDAWSAATNAGITIIAPGVIFSPEDAVAPDVVWVRTERLATVLQDDGKLHAAPDLMVEILSPGTYNQQRDRVKKLTLYAKWGVFEYWIVDWRARQLTVYRRAQSELRLLGVRTERDVVESPHLPGFTVRVDEFFARLPANLLPGAACDADEEE
ncbi:MAG: Uma2 family endonuclease [Chloroflexota bacterium]